MMEMGSIGLWALIPKMTKHGIGIQVLVGFGGLGFRWGFSRFWEELK